MSSSDIFNDDELERLRADLAHCGERLLDEVSKQARLQQHLDACNAANVKLADDNARLTDDRMRELHACPYCRKHEGGAVSPCVLHGGCAESKVEVLEDGLFRFTCPSCGVESDVVRSLRAENAELRADAERYRWLRNDNKGMHYTTDFDANGKYGKGDTVDIIVIEIPCAFDEPRWTPEGHFDCALELDAAIDAARGAQPTTHDES